jgi:type II secretory pathway component GspD/PulD (secretin)
MRCPEHHFARTFFAFYADACKMTVCVPHRAKIINHQMRFKESRKFDRLVYRPGQKCLILAVVSALTLPLTALMPVYAADPTVQLEQSPVNSHKMSGATPPLLLFTPSSQGESNTTLVVAPAASAGSAKAAVKSEAAPVKSEAAPVKSESKPAPATSDKPIAIAAKAPSSKSSDAKDAPSISEVPESTASTNGSETKSSADKKSVAQWMGAPDPTRHTPLPGVTGTVKIRKPFKIFVQEQLIHNMSFRETPVREVIAEIARRGNLNIIIDKSVTGKITGELRDVTYNEAMDSVLAAAGLQNRTLDNNTVIIATTQAMVQLGLNRPIARAFKLSYAHPYDVAMILHASIFNKGLTPDFQASAKRGSATQEGDRTNGSAEDFSDSQTNRPDVQRTVRGSSRSQTQEGVGFNNSAVDPGSQQIRAFQEVNTDYIVEQNGGGAICIPDSKNRQIIVVGTAEDVALAEESIRLLDRRPRQVHIQTSLIELTNQGVRQLGANLALQGEGSSGTILGNQLAPLVSTLPGFSSPIVGDALTAVPTIAGVTADSTAQSGFNYLTLAKTAGGKSNIATVPGALSVNLNLLLQTNKAKVVANPSVVVVDDTEALITIANEVVHKVTSTVSLGVVTTNVELTKAGIFLNVLPKLTQDGFVTMRLRPQVSTPIGGPQTFGTTVVTLLSVREIMTQEVRIKDGQTLILGGLFTEQEAANLSKVPYAAEAPIIGALFRNTLKGRNRTELMLLITPKIVEEDPPSSLSEGQVSPTM